ncbi:hypothetical protein AGLY_018210, partial [Aphis glycines]
MYRVFTAQGSYKWLSILSILIDNYNNSKHRTIGMTPVQAEENPALVTLKQRTIVNRKVKFHVGDKVRISTQKGVFTKGFLPNWSTEIFTIVKINKTEPPTYQLHDYHDEPIAGCFYTEEISKTNFPNDYLIEKIIRKKGNQLYVKWIGQQKYFIKEMFIADTETWTHQHFILKHISLKQDAKSRSVNNWLERLQHGLSLEYGDIEYGEIQKIFQSLTFDRIYVKGLQKQKIIEKFMPHATVFNIENLECPRLCQLNGDFVDNSAQRLDGNVEFDVMKLWHNIFNETIVLYFSPPTLAKIYLAIKKKKLVEHTFHSQVRESTSCVSIGVFDKLGWTIDLIFRIFLLIRAVSDKVN